MSNTNRSFSLIELVVVISIITILTIMAIPSYRKYEIKANISEGMVVIDMVNRVIAEYYSATGAFPPAATLAARLGTTYSSGYIVFNYKNVANIMYNDPGAATSIYYGVGFTFDVPSGSGRSYIYLVANTNNGAALTFQCGIWNISSPNSWHIIDPSYLPNSCNQTNVSAY